MPSSLSRAALLAKQIKRNWWWVTVCLVLLSATLSLYREELSIKRLDLTFYDLQSELKLPSSKYPQPKTALVIIDDESIARVGYWPWRRAEYVKALAYLGQAKAVGIDIFFHDYNPAYSQDDAYLAYAIESHGRVVLPSVIDSTTSYFPIKELAQAAAGIGYINVPPDSDGVVRRTQLYSDTATDTPLHFSLAMLQAGGDSKRVKQILSEEAEKSKLLIPFRGPAGTFDTYSFADVAQGKISPSTFENRYVLIGAWSSGLGDFYPTPLSSDELTSMSGVEILANTLENTLDNHWIRTIPSWLNILLSILPILFICVVLRHLRPRRAIVSTTLVMIVVFIGNWLLLNIFTIWVPPTASLIGIVLAYPVWYWRSQETVLRHINSELSEMSAQDPALHQLLEEGSPTNQYSLPERLSHLHKAIELFRKAQQQREETLRFISHDMRSPQNSILALIKMKRNNELHLNDEKLLEQVEHYADTTLALVDDFIDLARVEAMELVFEPTPLNDILVTICDDAWVRAQAKSIKVIFDEPEQGAWVSAAPQLLKRALANLIDNAIKYSSANTSITCLVSQSAHSVIIKIQDQGWGMPAEALDSIFQPFKRIDNQQENAPTGSGLGLAFVHAVVLRHFGEIHVESQLHVGTTFTISLPLSLQINNL